MTEGYNASTDENDSDYTDLDATAGSSRPDEMGGETTPSGLTAGGYDTSLGTDGEAAEAGGTPRGFGGGTATGGESSGSLGGSDS